MILVLGTLLSLGVHQYQLYKRHERVTAQAEKMIFQFAIIREHVTEALIEGKHSRLAGVADELEELNSDLSSILANKNIATEYKLSFFNSIDLPGIILLLRKIENGSAEPENLRQLNQSIRALGERLMLFDRVLVNYAKRKLISFQNIVIGALAIVVFMVVNIILIFYRQLLTPLMRLVRQAKDIAHGKGATFSVDNKSGEITELAQSFRELLQARDAALAGITKYQRVFEAVKRTRQAISHSKNVEDLFKDVCRALLSNQDYCLIWIGKPDVDGQGLMPVSADGTTSMSNKECDTCMTVLLTAAEEKGLEHNPAAQALQTGNSVVNRDILADIPKGLLKGTPLEDGNACCAAFPMVWHEKKYGVLSIYAISEESFDEREMELLEAMASDIALAVYCFELTNLNDDVFSQVKASRITALGELATSIAHEISDLSNGVINYAQVMVDEIGDDEKGRVQQDILDKISEEGERIADISKKLIFYGQDQKEADVYLPLIDVLKDSVLLTGNQLKNDGVALAVHLQEDLPELPVKAQHMQQVFLNLFSNARRSLNLRYPGKDTNKRIEIKSEITNKDGRKWVRIAFIDNGVGIEFKNIDDVFDPEFTTKNGDCVGQGFSISRDVMQEHDGVISLESEPGKYTAVNIDLPVG